MQKLKKIIIRNIQSIHDLEMELGDITLIAGKSRSGKSAFFRAVKGAVENTAGNSFVTIGKKTSSVTLDNVTWIQSKTRNEYEICRENATSEIEGCHEKFEKCGREVPEAISTELMMGKVTFGDGVKANLNFCDQLGQIFMVQGRGSDNAKVIGSITNLHQIYNGLRDAERDRGRTKSDLKEFVELYKKKVEQYDEIADQFVKVDRRYLAMKEIFDRAKEIEAKAKRLVELRTVIRDMDEKIKVKSKRLSVLKEIKFFELESNFRLIGRLMEGKKVFDKHLANISSVQRRIAMLEGIDAEKIKNYIDGVEMLSQAKSRLQRHGEDVDELKVKMKAVEDRVKIAKSDLDEFDVCDVCGSSKEHWTI